MYTNDRIIDIFKILTLTLTLTPIPAPLRRYRGEQLRSSSSTGDSVVSEDIAVVYRRPGALPGGVKDDTHPEAT